MFYRLWSPGQAGQWIVAITACITSLTCGQGFAWTSPVLPKIRSGDAGFNLTEDEEAWMITALFVGNLASPIPAGYIMDLIGRKNSLLIFDLMAVLSWAITYFSHSATELYLARFLMGLWAGFVYTLVPVFIGEVVSSDIRGSMCALMGVTMYFGGLYESLIGVYFDYKMMTILSSIPPILVFIILLFLPESPYFYIMKGKRHDAIKSLEWLRGSCDLEHLDTMEKFVKIQLETKSTFLDIFTTKAMRKAFLIVITLGILQRGAGIALVFSYITVILPDSWFPAKHSFVILSISYIIGSAASTLVMSKVGRRPLLLISTFGAAITMAFVSIWFYLLEFTLIDTSSTNILPLFLLFINGLSYAFGFVSIPNLVQGELFPVNLKGKASALNCISMSIASSVSVRIYHPITKYLGLYFNFVICSISCIIAFIFSAYFLIETRGKTLEEIQEILSEKKKKEKEKKMVV